MLVAEFDYHLPSGQIARFPAPVRDRSRLMHLDRQRGEIDECQFRDIIGYLQPSDLLVMNDTRVIPARLFGRKATGGKAEIFLVSRLPGDTECWSCLLRPSRGMRPNQELALSGGMKACVRAREDAETWLVEFQGNEDFSCWLEREGQMPLPPYLMRDADDLDRERYQTVFAQIPGAVAAPTAGLHFTPELLEMIRSRGVHTACITLHTGLGTFQPVRTERVEDHRIHTERYFIPEETALAIRATKECGGRVVAVGTTSARTLEFAADTGGMIKGGGGEADIFIYPGYRFKVVDALITNFHLPESTLLMLVSAFAGKDFVLSAYEQAIRNGYRFYSYGDAMFVT